MCRRDTLWLAEEYLNSELFSISIYCGKFNSIQDAQL